MKWDLVIARWFCVSNAALGTVPRALDAAPLPRGIAVTGSDVAAAALGAATTPPPTARRVLREDGMDKLLRARGVHQRDCDSVKFAAGCR